MDDENVAPAHPFAHIALSLSGGGVRAIGYHLGTLDYLERAGLLSQVHTLSSVSGGSLVATGYAVSLKKGESFQDFYDNVCEFLPELNTIEELLNNLRNTRQQAASESGKFITAWAEIFREKFFGRYYDDPTFGLFWNEAPAIHLKELIFNATEFRTGIAFRFQKSQYKSLIGNGNVWLDEEYAKSIKMSDIMAASSCLPAAMEPMFFPQDFHWPEDEWARRGKSKRPYCEKVEAHLKDTFGITSIPLMDGGIYDNQGVASVILTEARSYRGKMADNDEVNFDAQAGLEPVEPYKWAQWLLQGMERASDTANRKDMGTIDMFIVSDTPVRHDSMYAAELASGEKGIFGWLRRQSLGTIHLWGWIMTAVLSLGVFESVRLFIAGLGETLKTRSMFDVETLAFWLYKAATLLFPAVIVGLAVYALIAIWVAGHRMIEAFVETMPPLRRSLWSYVRRIRFGQVLDMASLRATSVSALTARIFMNRIRQLGYTLLYSHDEFGKRIMNNNINDIKSLSDGKISGLPDFVKPSKEAEFVVERAAKMKTKLWIDKPDRERHDLDILIAAGHLSTCFNVIEYLWGSHRDENGDLKENVRELFEFARADWLRLNENPYWLVDRRKNAGRDPGVLFWNSPSSRKRKWGLGKKGSLY